jgi:ornithine cyclodeaminase
LTEAELRSQIQLDLDAIECVEEAFHALATKSVIMPPIMRLDIIENNGEIDVKTAYIPGVDSLAIKISPGFFDNPELGLPSVNGLMVLFSTRTGMVEALLLDNGYLTDIRTAAAGAVAAKYLARADSRRAAILGAGIQAGLQLEALTLVRNIDSATIWGRDAGKAQSRAAELSQRLGIEVNTLSPGSISPRWVPTANIKMKSTPRSSQTMHSTFVTACPRSGYWVSCTMR